MEAPWGAVLQAAPWGSSKPVGAQPRVFAKATCIACRRRLASATSEVRGSCPVDLSTGLGVTAPGLVSLWRRCYSQPCNSARDSLGGLVPLWLSLFLGHLEISSLPLDVLGEVWQYRDTAEACRRGQSGRPDKSVGVLTSASWVRIPPPPPHTDREGTRKGPLSCEPT